MSDVPRNATARVSTGVSGLDALLHGGFLQNRIFLVQGQPGTGKTTLALHYLRQAMQEGRTPLYITLSETQEDLSNVAASHGWSLDGIALCDLSGSEDSLKADAQYTVFHPSEVELGETTQAILEQVERVQPTDIVFDGLSEVRLLARDPLRYRRQMLALKQYFADKQMTVLLLDDRATPLGDIQPESVVTGVMVLDQDTPIYGGTRRRLRISKVRGSDFLSGYHDYEIKPEGMVVYPRLVAASHRQVFPPDQIASNVPGLDTMLQGGLESGTTTLIMGPAGVGKTTVALQYIAYALQKGHRAAIYSFDEVLHMLLHRAQDIFPDVPRYLQSGQLHAAQIDPAELSPGAFACEVQRAVEEENTRLVVIDSLNGYMNSMPEERYLATHLHELFAYLNQKGVVTILIVAQHGLITNHDTNLEVSYLADTVLLLRYFEMSGEVCQAISVFKKRCGAHERTLREMRITTAGIEVGEPFRQFQGIMTGVPQYEQGAALPAYSQYRERT